MTQTKGQGMYPVDRNRYPKYIYYTRDKLTDSHVTYGPIELAARPDSSDLPRRGAHAWKTRLIVVECLSGILTSACPLVLQA